MTNGDSVNVVNISGLRGARMSEVLIKTRDQLRNNRVSIVCLAVALGTTALCPVASAQTTPSTTPATTPADTSPATAPPPASQSSTALPPVDVRPARQKRAARPKARPAQTKRVAPVEAPGPAEPRSLPETADRSPSGFAATRSSVGTKTDTPIMETPQSVSVVTQDQLQARAVQSITEALRYVPGVQTSSGGADPRFDLFKIRGFNTTGDGTYRDGLREIGSPDNFTLFRNNPYGIERIDVLRGPSSVLYGAGGPGGLINIISKKPTEQPFAEVYGLLGSEKRREVGFDVGGALDKDAHYLARLTGAIREGQAQVPYFSNFIPDDRYFIAPAFTWRPSEDTKLTILADVGHEVTGNNFATTIARLGVGGVVGVRPTTLFIGDPAYNKFDQHQFRVGYQFEHRLNDAVTVRQNLRYGEVDVDYRYLLGNGFEGSPLAPRRRRLVDEHMSSFTVDNHAQAKFTTGPLSHTMLVGLDFQRFGLDARFNGDAAPLPGLTLNLLNPQYYLAIPAPTNPLTSTDQTAKQLGAYIQDQIKFNNWVVTAGTRYDSTNLDSTNRLTSERTVRNDQAQSNKIGVVYLFDFGLAPYASYSESFLPNTGVDSSGGTFKPTTGQQYEAGARYTIPGTRVMVTFAAFDIAQQNVLQPDPNNADFRTQTGEIRSRGYEAELVANLAEGLNAVASYTRQDLEVTKSSSGVDLGKRPILTPSNLASAYLDYTIPTGQLTGLGFGAGVRYVGSTYMDNRNTALNDPYTLYDVGIHYKMANGVTAQLNVTNLFDKKYATCSFNGGCNWNAGRVVTGTMKYKW
jgi:iron complex outermembrane receptor protein